MTVGYNQVPTADDYDQAHAEAAQQAAVNVALPEEGVVADAPVEQWSVGLCECCNYGGLCCSLCWCGPCMLGFSHSALVAEQSDVMDVRVCGGLVGADALGFFLSRGLLYATHGRCCVPWAEWIGCCAIAGYTMWQRQQIRQKYGIAGDCCGDCIVSFFCFSCAAGQHHLELAQRGVNPGSVCCGPMRLPERPAHTVAAVQMQQPAYAVPHAYSQ